MSTYKEIADRANVSIGTVYRVAHNRGRVAKATEDRVRKAIEDLGYERNIFASNLSRQKCYRFGILMPRTHFDSGYWQAPYRGAMHAGAELKKYRVEIEEFLYDETSSRSFEYFARKAASADLDGLLVAVVVAVKNGSIADRLPADVPRVYFDSYIDDPDAVAFVGQDSYSSGRLAAHLMAMTLPEPASVIALRTFHGDPNSSSWTHHIEDRVRGFTDYTSAVERFKVIESGVDTADGVKAFAHALEAAFERNQDISGVFVSNSETHSAVDALESLNPQLCGQVHFIGYDLVEASTVYLERGKIDFLLCQRPFEQGYRGIHLLHRHVVLKESCPGSVILPTDIVTRENLSDHA